MNFRHSIILSACALGFATQAFAVDETPIGERMSVVGIAVLKDRKAGRTFAVKTGETVPGEPSFEVKSVRRNAVIVSNGSSQVILTYFDDAYAGSPVAQSQQLADTGSYVPAIDATKVVQAESLREAEPGKFFWVSESEADRQKAQDRLESNGIASGWESSTASDSGFSVTIDNGIEVAPEFESGSDSAADWYDSNDTAADIIERLNSISDGAPRYEPIDAVAPVATYIE